MSKIGERIKDLRKRNSMNQEELAKLLRDCYGLKTERAMISKWENGFQNPGIDTLVAIAKAFGVSLDYIACGDEGANFQKNNFIPLYEHDVKNAKRLVPKPNNPDADFCVLAERGNKALGVESGDYVFGSKEYELKNGNSVIVLCDDVIQIKTWYSHNDKGVLSGDGEKPVFIRDKDNIKILGKAVSMQRNI